MAWFRTGFFIAQVRQSSARLCKSRRQLQSGTADIAPASFFTLNIVQFSSILPILFAATISGLICVLFSFVCHCAPEGPSRPQYPSQVRTWTPDEFFSTKVVTVRQFWNTFHRDCCNISSVIALWRSLCRLSHSYLTFKSRPQAAQCAESPEQVQCKVTLLCIRRGSSYALGRPRRGCSYQLFVLPEQRTPIHVHQTFKSKYTLTT